MNSEAGYDGGVLEYNVGQTAWIDAYPLMVEGAYNAMLALSQVSALSGRPAWTGDMGAWQQVVLDLSPLAGSDVAFRWRFASDGSTGDEGWYVDDIRVISEEVTCETVLPDRPGEASAGGASPFTIEPDADGFSLVWSAPVSGGSVTDYVLYSIPITAPWSTPRCEGGLGSATAAPAVALPDDRGFLVVARNPAGEGSYGSRSDGSTRPSATASACP